MVFLIKVDPKIAAIEFTDDRLDATNQRPGIVAGRENDDVGRSSVIGNQQPTPERTLDRILEVFGAAEPGFDKLDILVLAQGAVIYRRGEFQMEGFRLHMIFYSSLLRTFFRLMT